MLKLAVEIIFLMFIVVFNWYINSRKHALHFYTCYCYDLLYLFYCSYYVLFNMITILLNLNCDLKANNTMLGEDTLLLIIITYCVNTVFWKSMQSFNRESIWSKHEVISKITQTYNDFDLIGIEVAIYLFIHGIKCS